MEELKWGGSLHNHTDYSNASLGFRDSINKVKMLLARANELNHSVIAITDHETTSSWIKVEYEMKNYPNLKIIRGNEIYLVRNGLNADNFNKEKDKYFHFILLAKDLIGAHQIMELSTRAWMRSYFSRRIRRTPTYYQDLFEVIGKNPGHIIGSTACLGGALPTQILRGTPDEKLVLWIQQLNNLFGQGNFYLEMQPSKNKEQITVNKKLLELSKLLNVPYIITTDSHYLKKEDRAIHKAYLNSQSGDREVDDFYATTYLMDNNEIENYFSYFTKDELQIAYKNINFIKDSCEEYSLLKPLKIPDLVWKEHKIYEAVENYYDKIPYLKVFMESDYIGDKKLCEAIIEGIESHDDLQNEQAYNEINSNLEMTWISSNVNKAHWSAYYLNLQKIIDLCWEAGSLVGPGRGSGVGFILLYVLGITQINPLRETTRVFSWRFLNPERVSVLDVDFDIEGSRRNDVLNKFREFYGKDRVSNVATFKTEKSKSAILTAARGLGIDVDTAQYIASLIPADRGQLRTLNQCMYGDEENDFKPIKQFVIEMTENYPELWKVASQIEGMINGLGAHAGGVIFVDEPFTNSCGLMRAPNGTIITQFELHDDEAVSLIKYDALSVEAMDKIHNCIDLICDYGYAERKSTLKETYESLINIYNIERNDPKMWQMVWDHKISSLFQMEKQSGINGISILHPTSVDDLAILNSTIRLMSQEKGGEMPTEKLARFKRNPDNWLAEMKNYGLGEKEQKILAPVLSMSYGLCIAQEQFMELVQLPELGGFSLTWADKLRKSIAKKNPKEFDQLTKEFFEITKEKGIDQNFTNYVWNVCISMSKGYGFNQSHTLAYSLIALQEMNLAYKYPIVFWNCACLITDAGGNEDEEIEEIAEVDENEIQVFNNDIEDFSDDEEEIEDEDEDVEEKTSTKKKKTKSTNYGKIASAIGKMKSEGINISLPDINKSTYTFSPDVENSLIRYGLSGITGVGDEIIKEIFEKRPFNSFEDAIMRVKFKKPQIINLIKCGAFDSFDERWDLMNKYINLISDTKSDLNLRNMQMLINHNLIPEEIDLQRRIFNFNKYLKTLSQDSNFFLLDSRAVDFYSENFDSDKIKSDGENLKLNIDDWKKIYTKSMDPARDYIKAHKIELLEKLNNELTAEVREKYADGNLSKWEMDSVSCYSHSHELSGIKKGLYGIEDFSSLPEEPEVDYTFTTKDGKRVPLYRITRIAGTVLDRNTQKRTVTLLTTNEVVTVQIFGDVFSYYDKQISARGADGKKHVIEKGFFKRGNKIIVTGIRRENLFVAKKYSRTPYHLVELITKINEDGTLELKGERAKS